ncbi:MAG: hypothetical protein GY786_18440, partial [Proteobacteria bacterium]|nr:hypothetical protein [Pseudomonadota bacterium]
MPKGAIFELTNRGYNHLIGPKWTSKVMELHWRSVRWRGIEGFSKIKIAKGGTTSVSDGIYKVITNKNSPGESGLGLAVHSNNDTSSIVLGIIPNGKEVFFEDPLGVDVTDDGKVTATAAGWKELDHLKYNFLNEEVSGWVYIKAGKSTLEAKRKIDPVLDVVVNCELPITGGDVVGYFGGPGCKSSGKNDCNKKRAVHIDVFTEDIKFFDNPAEENDESIFELTKDTTFYSPGTGANVFTPDSYKLENHYYIEKWHCQKMEKDGTTWRKVKVPADPKIRRIWFDPDSSNDIDKWVNESNLKVLSAHNWPGFI